MLLRKHMSSVYKYTKIFKTGCLICICFRSIKGKWCPIARTCMRMQCVRTSHILCHGVSVPFFFTLSFSILDVPENYENCLVPVIASLGRPKSCTRRIGTVILSLYLGMIPDQCLTMQALANICNSMSGKFWIMSLTNDGVTKTQLNTNVPSPDDSPSLEQQLQEQNISLSKAFGAPIIFRGAGRVPPFPI